MRNRSFLMRMVSVAAVISVGFGSSCSEDEPQFSQEAGYAVEESNVDAYYADADDMAGVAVAESEETEGGRTTSGARQLELNDDRFCNGISVELDLDLSQLPTLPIGDITINFGNGCEDARGNIRKGKIKVHFRGRKFRPGSIISITFDNYQINNVTLNGVRTLTNLPASTVGAPKFQIELTGGSVAWDGNVVTREHCFSNTWERGALLDPTDDLVIVTQCPDADQAAEGVNRKGIHYRVYITKPLTYKRGCPMAISGTKKFVEVDSGKEIIIDYGSGTCDASITLTVNGNIRNVRSRR